MAKPGPRCSVCGHAERHQLDLAIARGTSLQALARRFSIGPDALFRHKKRHLTAALRAKLLAGPDIANVDLDKLREVEGQSLLANLLALRHRLFDMMDQAEAVGDAAGAARAAGLLQKNFELCARLLGEINSGSVTTNNILISPQFLELRFALVKALGPHPEAAQAVALVLHTLEDKAADTITAAAQGRLTR